MPAHLILTLQMLAIQCYRALSEEMSAQSRRKTGCDIRESASLPEQKEDTMGRKRLIACRLSPFFRPIVRFGAISARKLLRQIKLTVLRHLILNVEQPS